MTIIDLSVEIANGAQPWPAHPRAIVAPYMWHEATRARFRPPCEGFASTQLILVDHFGTHVDAPYHFFPDGATTEQLPLEALCGPAVLLDCSARPLGEPVGVADLEAAERAGSPLRAGDIALVRCFPGDLGEPGWAACRGLAEPAARWLADRRARAVGVDLGTADDHTDLRRPAHLLLLGRGIPIVENLANLGRIGDGRFVFIGLPLRLRQASGSPIRAVALAEPLLAREREATWTDVQEGAGEP